MQKWKLGRVRGQGLSGSIYNISQTNKTEPQELVAKVYRDALGDDVIRELLFLTALKGEPNIISLYDLGFGKQFPGYLEMVAKPRLCEIKLPLSKKRKRPSKDLSDIKFPMSHAFALLPRYSQDLFQEIENKQLSPKIKFDILKDILCGLKAVHRHHLVYVDLKPENVLSKGDHHVLADFGLSSPHDWLSTSCEKGTIAYKPPETLFSHLPCTYSHDIWSLGILAWTLFSGVSFTTTDPETDPKLAAALGSLKDNPRVLAKLQVPLDEWEQTMWPQGLPRLMHLFGLMAALGTFPETLPLDHPWDVIVQELVHEIKQKSSLQSLYQERNTRIALAQRNVPLFQDFIVPHMLTWNPKKRASLDEISKAFEGYGTSSTCHLKELSERKHYPASTSLDSRLTTAIQSIYDMNPYPKKDVHLKQNISEALELTEQYLKMFKDNTPLVQLVALWLSLKNHIETFNLTLQDLCELTQEQDPSWVCDISILQSIAQKMLIFFPDILSQNSVFA